MNQLERLVAEKIRWSTEKRALVAALKAVENHIAIEGSAVQRQIRAALRLANPTEEQS